MIIGISGRIGSGKDTVGKVIQYLTTVDTIQAYQQYDLDLFLRLYKSNVCPSGWEVKKFATKLRQVVSILTGVSVADLEKEEVKNTLLPESWQLGSKYPEMVTYRHLLQRIGTEAMRDMVHPNIWVNALMSDYHGYSTWVITDLRFPNEARAIKNRGGILIRLNRDVPRLDHYSETALDNYDFDYRIDNNGTLEELVLKIKKLLFKEGLIKTNK